MLLSKNILLLRIFIVLNDCLIMILDGSVSNPFSNTILDCWSTAVWALFCWMSFSRSVNYTWSIAYLGVGNSVSHELSQCNSRHDTFPMLFANLLVSISPIVSNIQNIYLEHFNILMYPTYFYVETNLQIVVCTKYLCEAHLFAWCGKFQFVCLFLKCSHISNNKLTFYNVILVQLNYLHLLR